MNGAGNVSRWPVVVALACSLLLIGLGAGPGLAERPRVYAITNATVVSAPGQSIKGATVVLRDGLIDAVGGSVTVPADAEEIDGSGLHVYPGLIDPLTGLGQAGSPPPTGTSGGASSTGGGVRRATPRGPVHPISRVRPETRASDALLPFSGDRTRVAERYRQHGFTTVLTAPESGIFRGTSAVIQIRDDAPVAELILRDGAFQHVGFSRGGFGRGYPSSLMGAVATIRQVLLDAQRHAVWTERHAKNPRGMPRPERLVALETLAPLVGKRQAAMFHAESPEDVFLADRLARELDLNAVIAASGHEWEAADRVAAAGRPLILPVRFPDKPKLQDEDERLDVSIQEMERFVEAPGAAAKLHEAGVRFALTTHGMKSLTEFPRNMRKILDAGLPEGVALAALTTVPAEMLGIGAMAGTLEPGKVANAVVLDGPLFGEETKVRRVFVDGVEYKMKEKKKLEGVDPDAVVDPRGEWSVVFEFGSRAIEREWTISGEKGAYSGTAETQQGTVTFDEIRLEGNLMTVVFPARGGRPSMELELVVRGDSFEGNVEMGPRSFPVKGTRTSGPEGGGR